MVAACLRVDSTNSLQCLQCRDTHGMPNGLEAGSGFVQGLYDSVGNSTKDPREVISRRPYES